MKTKSIFCRTEVLEVLEGDIPRLQKYGAAKHESISQPDKKGIRLQFVYSGCHTGIESLLTSKKSHVKPSPCGGCPEGRRTRVTQ